MLGIKYLLFGFNHYVMTIVPLLLLTLIVKGVFHPFPLTEGILSPLNFIFSLLFSLFHRSNWFDFFVINRQSNIFFMFYQTPFSLIPQKCQLLSFLDTLIPFWSQLSLFPTIWLTFFSSSNF